MPLTLDRTRLHWEDLLREVTPIEDPGSGVLYKREDRFAPLGYGGINGAKLRQLIYLVHRYVSEGGSAGLLTGASVLSPQLSMAALVARHYDLPATLVLGATRPDTCGRHENVRIAAQAGAEFLFHPVGFNPALQAEVTRLHALPEYEARFKLCYGITTPVAASDADVEEFHRVGARQAENVPESVRTIVMTAGSCNSCVSVLYGLALAPPPGLERIVLLGVGPTRLQWIEDRLEAIERHTWLNVRGRYRRRYHHHPDLEHEHQTDGEILLEHFDLHATGYCTYQDRAPFTLDGIVFHPTYEGKALKYLFGMPLRRSADGTHSWFTQAEGDVLFWIVGSAPSQAAMTEAFIIDGLI